MTAPYPLIFEPILLKKVWGGRRLARYGKALPDAVGVGESWELADLAATSASGAGGGAAHSRIANGELQGATIREAMLAWGPQLIAAPARTADGGFPLLVKFLDAKENLSVQVHPSPAYAAAHPEAHLKTECWYILDAEPGSLIYKGIKPGVTADAFRRHIAEGTVVDDLIAVPAVVGECHLLPSGTCHALGAGVLVAEVQTPSDTTFRVYDWGRTGRALHVEPALACIDFGPAPAATRLPAGRPITRLVKTPLFNVDEAEVPVGEIEPAAVGPGSLAASGDARVASARGVAGCAVLILLSGSGELVGSDRPAGSAGAHGPVVMQAGTTALVPAAIAGDVVFRALEPARLLRVSLGA